MSSVTLSTTQREFVGKNSAKFLRAKNQVPGVIYGNNISPVNIYFDCKEFEDKFSNCTLNTKALLDVKGSKDRYEVLIKKVERHPVSDSILHVDFIFIGNVKNIICTIPLRFANQSSSPILKRGGFLNIIHKKVFVNCHKDHIPQFLSVDLLGFDGGSIKSDVINLPEGVELVNQCVIASSIGGKKS